MPMIQAFMLRGGSHDGEKLGPTERGAHPETLFLIELADGEAYARAGEQVRDAVGKRREVFQFDPDGTLTERARRTFAGI